MSLIRFFLSISFFIVFASCEDTQSKQKTEVTPSTSVSKKSIENKSIKKKKVQKKKPFKVSNDNLKEFFTQYGKKNPETLVRITTRYGSFDIKLTTKTPIHRANFIYLVKQRYFDETFFYRVAKGFVIQGGNSDRTQMSQKRFEIGDYTLPQEQLPGVTHIRGSVALSKQWVDNPSNRSTPFEFFVVVAKQGAPHLNGEHTIFGQVVKGMNVVDKISNVPTDISEWPLKNIFIKAEVIR